MIYLTGDATWPQTDNPFVVAHICNDVGKWGRGFVLAVEKRWPRAKEQYLRWYRQPNNDFGLGKVQFVAIGAGYIANMVAQHGTRGAGNPNPIRYNALEECLRKVNTCGYEVHMPMIGTGLAGGDWNVIEPLIERTLIDVEVFVYVLTEARRQGDYLFRTNRGEYQ